MMYIIVIFGIFGMLVGSFLGAQVWRLRARQLVEDKHNGEGYDVAEYRRLSQILRPVKEDRSRCLMCGHTLQWYDLFPLFSWLSTGGRCRYCKSDIGTFEPLIELSTSLFTAVSAMIFFPHMYGPLDITRFVIWLIAGYVMIVLWAYDAKWSLLPLKLNYVLIFLAAIYWILGVIGAGTGLSTALLQLAGSIAIMSGIYLCFYLVSRGEWIGFGDIILGVGLALLLGAWQYAFGALFLANFLGLLYIIPLYIAKKVGRRTHMPFGPFLILATMIMVLVGGVLVTYFDRSISTLTDALLML